MEVVVIGLTNSNVNSSSTLARQACDHADVTGGLRLHNFELDAWEGNMSFEEPHANLWIDGAIGDRQSRELGLDSSMVKHVIMNYRHGFSHVCSLNVPSLADKAILNWAKNPFGLLHMLIKFRNHGSICVKAVWSDCAAGFEFFVPPAVFPPGCGETRISTWFWIWMHMNIWIYACHSFLFIL